LRSPGAATGTFLGPLGPAEFRKAYGFAPTGSTAHLAIVDAFDTPTLIPDLTVYAAEYGLPAPKACRTDAAAGCIAVRNQRGAQSPLPPATEPGWQLETALDVEVAYGICPTCRITLYEGDASTFEDLSQAVDTAAAQGNTVVSNSYGAYLSDCSNADVGYNHPHVAVVVSSGDSAFGIACPAVLPTVVSIGGTTLTLNTNASYLSETVWFGSGSGCSHNPANKARPWQPRQSNWPRTGCKGLRGMNDVAADADPNTGAAVYSTGYSGTGAWYQIGGTSLAAPIIAAGYALSGNAGRWAYPAQSLYAAPGASLHDVKSGANSGGCPYLLGCTAARGYDLPTGVGTPKGLGAL
jgi:subtilase family serine protease